jgi:hypothetical protein
MGWAALPAAVTGDVADVCLIKWRLGREEMSVLEMGSDSSASEEATAGRDGINEGDSTSCVALLRLEAGGSDRVTDALLAKPGIKSNQRTLK